MPKMNNHQLSKRFVLATMIAVVYFGVSLGGVQSAYAYNVGNYEVDENNVVKSKLNAHEWIIEKAVDYLNKKDVSIAKRFPLESYLPWLNYGVWYADNSAVKCIWDYPGGGKKFGCDQLHHYGQVDDIRVSKGGVIGVIADGASVGHPGEFAAPFYAQVLYEQAVKFWPGANKPNLKELPYKNAGRAKGLLDVTSLHSTYVGGLPLCEAHEFLENNTTLISLNECPKWPEWAATDPSGKTTKEDVEVAMKYLGWAIHMVEDMTVPYHAFNEASDSHQRYEDRVDNWIHDGSFDHLPLSSNANYQFRPCNLCIYGEFSYPVVPDFYRTNWAVEQFANEAGWIAIETHNGSAIQPSYEEYKEANGSYGLVWTKSHAERNVDAAIKLVAGVLEKFFSEVSLTPDAQESNEYFNTPKLVTPGSYNGLSIHNPSDQDWYKINVPENFSDLVVDIYYDKSEGELSAEIQSLDHSYDRRWPYETSYGKRFQLTGIQSGNYLIHIQSFDLQPTPYSMKISLATGSLPKDRYEDNDTAETAQEFYTGCDFTGTLNIDRVGDDDFYQLEVASSDRVKTDIWFDPTQGSLQLYVDGIEATETVLQEPNNQKLSISRDGLGKPSIVRITGDRISYSICMGIQACVANSVRDCTGKNKVAPDPVAPTPDAPESNENSCERYAYEAIRQDQANQALGAGFGYPVWSSDFKHHYNWCRHGDNALRTPWEAGERERELQEYAVETDQSPCQRYAREAVRQYHASEGLDSIDFNPPVWSDNHYNHLTWCQHGDNIESSIEWSAYREHVLQDYAVKYNLYEGRDISFTTDFEEGFLRGWMKTGRAFDDQPTKGDNPTARLRGQPSHHEASYWIGTYESYQGRDGQHPGTVQGDSPTGTLTSPYFEVGSEISFLIGGGGGPDTRVELVVDDDIVRTAFGRYTETFHRVTWDVSQYASRTGQIRVVDDDSGGWGHINFDDLHIIPKITETMTDRCGSEVAIVPGYGGEPNTRGTLILKRGDDGKTGWTEPFNVELSREGRIRWWCNSTKGNWADPWTWRFSASGFNFGCTKDLVIAAATFGSSGKLCFPIEGFGIGSSSVDGWTPERSRCSDRSSRIRARLGTDRLLQIQCLGD